MSGFQLIVRPLLKTARVVKSLIPHQTADIGSSSLPFNNLFTNTVNSTNVTTTNLTTTSLVANGKALKQPKFTVLKQDTSATSGTNVVQNLGSFTSTGGTLRVIINFSAVASYSNQHALTSVTLDGVSVGGRSFTFSSTSVRSPINITLILTGIAAGIHSLSLQCPAVTSSSDDWITCIVEEFFT